MLQSALVSKFWSEEWVELYLHAPWVFKLQFIMGEGCSYVRHVVINLISSLSLSGRTVALGSTQPLPEVSTKYISCGVKAAGT